MFYKAGSMRRKVSPKRRKIASKRRTIAPKRRNCTFLFHFGYSMRYFESFWFRGVASKQLRISP